MLVEDPETETSAASLHVNAGSLADPIGINGLAHYCEHMLSHGTKQFPEENYFDEFISNNGGSKNAATGEDYTTYFFDVKNNSFP